MLSRAPCTCWWNKLFHCIIASRCVASRPEFLPIIWLKMRFSSFFRRLRAACWSFLPSRLLLLRFVPYSIASISLLGNGGDTLKTSRIDNINYKAMGTVFSYGDSSTLPVPVQTKSPSSSDADNTASSTPVPPPSGMPSEEIVAEPALMLTPDRRASATALTAQRRVSPPSRRLRPS